MDYDVVIIGAGLSGLAAGVRLTYFGQRVCLVERHRVPGGLNSYYLRDGRVLDVGLHALTNYAPADRRDTPIAKMLRQLRLRREDLDLCPQHESRIAFPDATLRFNNDPELLFSQIAERFPSQVDRFRTLWDYLLAYDDLQIDVSPASARAKLSAYLTEPLLIEMLLCPIMFYGSATEDDMDLTTFDTVFKGVFRDGLARPRIGIRRILRELLGRYRAAGGAVRMGDGVARINVEAGRVRSLTLESGAELTARHVLSCAGHMETVQLCSDVAEPPPADAVGRVSVAEVIVGLDCPPASLGLDATIVFFSDRPRFVYAVPEGLFRTDSGLVCCPNNYAGLEDDPGNLVRMTALANHAGWARLAPEAYAEAKADLVTQLVARAERFAPGLGEHIVFTDSFTPRTISDYTGRLNGAIYGAPHKRRDGSTHLANLALCGTDQGLIGIMGALLSGIWMANHHVLAPP